MRNDGWNVLRGAGAAQGARRALAAAGFAGREPCAIRGAHGAAAFVPLAADLPPGATAMLAVAVQLCVLKRVAINFPIFFIRNRTARAGAHTR